MRVLSLFDGISCGYVALQRAGIPVTQYFASEIDKYAIKISRSNHPEIIQLGCVKIVRKMAEAGVFGHLDLLIAGSPCQGFSFAGEQLAFQDPRSALFFDFIWILHALRQRNPNIKFMLENVKMKKKHLDVISYFTGVQPVRINSALVSAQNRDRFYWCNWPVSQPADRGILLRDIIESGAVDREKSYCIDANYFKGGSLNNYLEKSRRQIVFAQSEKRLMVKEEGNRAIAGINMTKTGIRPYKDDGRKGSLTEIGTIGLPDTKSAAITTVNTPKIIGGAVRGRYEEDGSTSQRVELNDMEKSNALTTVQKDSVVVMVKQYPRGKNPGFEKPLEKSPTLTGSRQEQNLSVAVIGHTGDNYDMHGRVYSENGKAPTLIANPAGGSRPPLVGVMQINPSKEAAGKQPHMQNRIYDMHGKSIAITAAFGDRLNVGSVEEDNTITYRKLTCIECERLQTLPDGYTSAVSNTQRYKALGNGWTAEVIAHIFSEMPR